MTKYSRWNPNRVHFVHGIPVIYNKADTAITQRDAEQRFKTAVRTMHNWASRAFKLAMATDNSEGLRDYHLEHLEWELDNIAAWLASMRGALEEARGEQREQDKIDAMLALAESTTFREEADTARRMAAERQDRQRAG